MRTTYNVTGMTCDHCAQAVAAEVGMVEGVSAVEVDVERGAVVVDGAGFTDEAVAAAVTEAGYAVT